MIKPKAKCLISFHDMIGTPSYDTLVGIAESQIKAGADICKIVTTAQNFEDNLTHFEADPQIPGDEDGSLCDGRNRQNKPDSFSLAGGYFTYACMAPGKESAAGQIPVKRIK